jgi:heme A synthase
VVLLAFPTAFTYLADQMIGATGALQTLYAALAVLGVYLTIVGWRPARTSAPPEVSRPGTTYPRAA